MSKRFRDRVTQEDIDKARETLRDSAYDASAYARDNPADAAVLVFFGFCVGAFVTSLFF